MNETNSYRDAEALLEAGHAQLLPSYPDLRGSKVFITGGASGVGAYLVAAFALQGAKVGFVSLPGDPGQDLCDRVLEICSVRPSFYRCDISDIGLLRQTISQFEQDYGSITTLINNAGLDRRHDLESCDVDEWDHLQNVNLRPHFFTAQAARQGMKSSGGGSIINMGSNSSLLGLAGYPAYVAAKAGIVGLTKALARELGTSNIRVNALLPGWVMTERQRDLWVTPEALQECLSQQCLKSTLSGVDVAQAALFLASNASAMISGQALVVDGGRV